MGIRTLKPTSAGRRFQTILDFDEITKVRPEKSLVVTKKRTGGRNSLGRITTRHIGGGHKQKIRLVDFRREKLGVPARAAIEYDPNRSARIALLHYRDGEKRYILAPNGLKVDDTVVSGRGADILPGNALPSARSQPARRSTTSSSSPARVGNSVGARAPARLVAKEGRWPTSSSRPARPG